MKEQENMLASLKLEAHELRQEISDLQKKNLELQLVRKQKHEVEHSLGERVKELNCLYALSEIIERHRENLAALFRDFVDLLPISWQYPKTTCAMIDFEGEQYFTDNYQPTRWSQKSDIYQHGEKAGTVEVLYLKKMPTIYEGPFLREERLLIDAVAERIGRAIERIRAQKQLQLEQETTRNTNIALKEVLSKVQEEKREVADSVQANVNKVIFPIIFAMEIGLPLKYRDQLSLLKNNLTEIASPFTNRLSRDFMSLTPVEMQICAMLKKGLSSKEIARLRGISPSTIDRHREHIRKKLGLVNQGVNLITFLETYMQ